MNCGVNSQGVSRCCGTPCSSAGRQEHPCVTDIEGTIDARTILGSSLLPRRARRVFRTSRAPPTLWHSPVKHPVTADISVHNTNMPEATAADRQNAILDGARKLYSDGKFKAALAAFKEASS